LQQRASAITIPAGDGIPPLARCKALRGSFALCEPPQG
jgi:hypothetical protein